MNNYDEIKKLYDNSVIYNNEFINYDDDFFFLDLLDKKNKPKKSFGNWHWKWKINKTAFEYCFAI